MGIACTPSGKKGERLGLSQDFRRVQRLGMRAQHSLTPPMHAPDALVQGLATEAGEHFRLTMETQFFGRGYRHDD